MAKQRKSHVFPQKRSNKKKQAQHKSSARSQEDAGNSEDSQLEVQPTVEKDHQDPQNPERLRQAVQVCKGMFEEINQIGKAKENEYKQNLSKIWQGYATRGNSFVVSHLRSVWSGLNRESCELADTWNGFNEWCEDADSLDNYYALRSGWPYRLNQQIIDVDMFANDMRYIHTMILPNGDNWLQCAVDQCNENLHSSVIPGQRRIPDAPRPISIVDGLVSNCAKARAICESVVQNQAEAVKKCSQQGDDEIDMASIKLLDHEELLKIRDTLESSIKSIATLLQIKDLVIARKQEASNHPDNGGTKTVEKAEGSAQDKIQKKELTMEESFIETAAAQEQLVRNMTAKLHITDPQASPEDRQEKRELVADVEKVAEYRAPKTKIKTRGIPNPPPSHIEDNSSTNDQIAKPKWVFKDQNLYNTWRQIFPSPGSKDKTGDLTWEDFVRAMSSEPLCFEVYQGHGVEYQFVRPPTSSNSRLSLVLHKPHGSGTFSRSYVWTLKSRLRQRFGWDAEDFVLEH